MLNFEELLNLSEISENYLTNITQDFKSELEKLNHIRKNTLIFLEENKE